MPLAPLETPEELEALGQEAKERLDSLAQLNFSQDFDRLPLKAQWAVEAVLGQQWEMEGNQ